MPSRPRSPCKDGLKTLPKYKTLARGLRKGSKERLTRYRYQQPPGSSSGLCRVVDDQAPGRTQCYAPTEHSARRKTCNLLVDPAHPRIPDLEPSLYLYGGPRFQEEEDLVCKKLNFETFEEESINTGTSMPPPYSVAVLGPFVDLRTRRLQVRCIDMQAFEEPSQFATSLNSFGQCFLHLDPGGVPEASIPVPTSTMLQAFVRDLKVAVDGADRVPVPSFFPRLIGVVEGHIRNLQKKEVSREGLDRMCQQHPDFQKKVRLILRLFWEVALYSRRWGGPECKPPIDRLPDPVGRASNPLSPKLVNKYVISTLQGVRLVTTGNIPADLVDGYGMLTGMQQALGQSIRMIFDSLSDQEKTTLRRALAPGTKCYYIDGSGWWTTFEELNSTDPPRNGNPRGFQIDIFAMYFGTPRVAASGHEVQHPLDLVATSSVFGTNGYCVQLAASMLGRSVLTTLPYVYKTRPTWAATDGLWQGLHT